jgi:hypothetical protein
MVGAAAGVKGQRRYSGKPALSAGTGGQTDGGDKTLALATHFFNACRKKISLPHVLQHCNEKNFTQQN